VISPNYDPTGGTNDSMLVSMNRFDASVSILCLLYPLIRWVLCLMLIVQMACLMKPRQVELKATWG